MLLVFFHLHAVSLGTIAACAPCNIVDGSLHNLAAMQRPRHNFNQRLLAICYFFTHQLEMFLRLLLHSRCGNLHIGPLAQTAAAAVPTVSTTAC
jgi:hypothetical protein